MKKISVKNKTSKTKGSQKNGKTASRVPSLLGALKKAYPGAHCALNFNNPLQMLFATILSAQCTDKRVNLVTPVLFSRYRTVEDFADADPEELMSIIKSTGFYRNKAKNIKAAAQLIESQFKGQVPSTMDDLLTLPGVARKTANVVLYNAFGKNEGITVDTHVLRVSARLGLTRSDKPAIVEKDLMKILPRHEWGQFSHLLIELGRDVCKAPRPYCKKCRLRPFCPWNKRHPELSKD